MLENAEAVRQPGVIQIVMNGRGGPCDPQMGPAPERGNERVSSQRGTSESMAWRN